MKTADNSALIEILLVEDNPADIRLTKEALKESRIRTNLNVVQDGEQALAYLKRQGQQAAARRPHLILLDLNLPKKDGREVLAEIKLDPELSRIPVVVLTTSSSEVDVVQSYGLHANCYIVKPVDFQQFTEVIRSVEDFWFEVAKLPT